MPAPIQAAPSVERAEASPEASASLSPWLDLAPTAVLARAEPRVDRRLASALAVGGLYAGFVTWTYFAWYRKEGHAFRAGGDGSWQLWRDDGWLGTGHYAGGADKMGHAWATLALARAGTEILDQWGGYSRLTSALVGTALSEALFLGVEVKDGYVYRFSYGDLAFNTAGAALALAQSLSPRIDDLVDFRVQYLPSQAYRARAAGGDLDIAEDYSGQTFLLAFHLSGIPPLRDAGWGGWTRFVDVSLGYQSRGYKPDPPYKVDPTIPGREDYAKSRSTFLGLSLNAQGLFDYLLRGRAEGLRKVTHGMFEVFSLPASTLPVLDRTAVPGGMVPDDQN